ncbi:hypothetical protein [Paenibacillus ihuae]|uniref:hypothetical protein n=1 Tax=Paenibacillus ihuae TaxID=1232431 RepID=UPI0006D58F3A|nr:hypothetical protein [Paenibacillus ihuae]
MYLSDILIETKSIDSRASRFLVSLSILSTVFIQFFLGTDIYSDIRILLYMLLAVTVAITVPKLKIVTTAYYRFYMLIIYLTYVMCLALSFFNSRIILSPALEITMPFALLAIGHITSFKLEKLLNMYVLLTTLLALFLVYFMGSGFQISAQYLISSKNQVGPFIASSVIILFFKLKEQKNKLKVSSKIICFLLLITSISCALIIRNRSGLLALTICIGVNTLINVRLKNTLGSVVKLFFLFF